MADESDNLMEQIRDDFRIEAEDLMLELEQALLMLETQPDDLDILNRAFRAMHTIKGSGAAVELFRVSAFVHHFESAIDMSRKGALAVTPQLIELSLQSLDRIRTLLKEGSIEPVDKESITGEPIIDQLRQLCTADEKAEPADNQPKADEQEDQPVWHYLIHVKPDIDFREQGCELIHLLNKLQDLGDARIRGVTKEIPLAGHAAKGQAFLWWAFELFGSGTSIQIHEVFANAKNHYDVRVEDLTEHQKHIVSLSQFFSMEMLNDFREDTEEHFNDIESQLLNLEKDEDVREVINNLFRDIHSTKGNAALLISAARKPLPEPNALQWLCAITHASETLLDDLRKAPKIEIKDETIDTLFQMLDSIRELTRSFLNESEPPRIVDELMVRLRIDLEEFHPVTSKRTEGRAKQVEHEAFCNIAEQTMEMLEGCIRIIEPEKKPDLLNLDVYRRGLNNLVSAAARMGQDKLIELATQQVGLIQSWRDDPATLDRLSHQSLCQKYEQMGKLVQRCMETDADGEAVKVSKGAIKRKADKEAASTTMRVEEEKIDRIMRAVGELLIARGAFPLLSHRLGEERNPIGLELKEASSRVTRIADELQSAIMSIRMMPVKNLFQRYPRMVRDMARNLRKDIEFMIAGEETEMDKNMLEQLGDPLVHLIRNAVDHGVEKPEQRVAAGKPAQGVIRLSAYNEGGMVIIKIADDGKGMDPALLKRKAMEKGILTEQEALNMSDAEAYELIFAPGFSTVAEVTDVSGRGVGMDVVRSNIQRMQGIIQVNSSPGEGSVIMLKLPTSLMVSQTILVEAGNTEYMLPMENMLALEKVPVADMHVFREDAMAMIRGRMYPLLSLGELMQLVNIPDADGAEETDNAPESADREIPVAILRASVGTFAVAIDRFAGQEQVVVKPLEGVVASSRVFSGATIMGDGRIVLVINPNELLQLAAVDMTRRREAMNQTQ